MKTRLSPTTCLSLMGLLALTPCGQAQPHKSKPHKPTPARHAPAAQGWQPDPALLKKLDAPYSLDGYTIRPPKGYTLEQKPVEQTQTIHQVYRWAAEKRGDQSQPDLTVIVIVPQPGYHFLNNDKLLSGVQKTIQGDLTDYVQSPVANGSIHDMDFTRTYWKGTDRETAQHIHGFTYTYIDTRTAVLIIGQDAEPYHQTTIALAEAAAETFRPE